MLLVKIRSIKVLECSEVHVGALIMLQKLKDCKIRFNLVPLKSRAQTKNHTKVRGVSSEFVKFKIVEALATRKIPFVAPQM